MNRMSALLIGGALLGAVACGSDGTGPSTLGPCSSTATPGSALNLPVGGVRVFSTPQSIGCVILPSAPDAEYLFVVSNANSELDVERQFALSARPDTSVAALATTVETSPALVTAPGAFDVEAARAELSHGSAREFALRAWERDHLDPRVARASLATRRARLDAGLRGAVATAPVPVVGQQIAFRVPGSTNPCTNFASINAVVKYVGARAAIVQDLAAPANGFTDADFKAIADEFDGVIFPTATSYFGNATDVDDNGGRVFILFTPEINKLTPPNSTGGLFAGFFFAGDFFPRSGSGACAQSNLSEVFYLLVPDPTGQFSKPQSRSQVQLLTAGTVAHELQHMINAGIRFNHPTAEFEEVWLDEGLAHLAEEVVGRAKNGYEDLRPLSYSDVVVSATDYGAYYEQNLQRFALWLRHPDTSSAVSKHADENLSSRGAAWALTRYASEKYSGGNVRDFTRRLVAGPEIGLQNLTLRSAVPFDTILAGFAVANYSDDLGVAGLNARYTYTSWNMRDAIGRAVGTGPGSYPLLVTSLATGGGAIQGETRTAAASYVRYAGTATSRPVVARVTNSSATALATHAGGRLYLLRTR